LGRGGIRTLKREGDGATPRGNWRIVAGLTRLRRARSGLPLKPIRHDDAWCDDPDDPRYNHPVRLPYPASHERLWRDDRLYDVILVLDHNTRPRLRGRGSAVFFHLREAERPTSGCVAIDRADMLRLLPHLKRGSRLIIH
jgi:L,D-peptidoglycan transpeptidase YkuD (ErfK/YbiS/YcfS/YnhG family)